MKDVEFIAHRGAYSPGRRENTVAAIERASESGRFSFIEFDVRRTRTDEDGTQHVVVIHDENLNSIYENQRVPISKQRQKDLPINGLRIDQIKNEHLDIPILEEAVKAAGDTPLYVDIKSDDSIEPTITFLAEILNERQRRRLTLAANNKKMVEHIHKYAPDIQITLNYGLNMFPRGMKKLSKKYNITRISINKWMAPIIAPVAMLSGIKQRFAYSVKTKFEVKLLKLFGVNGFITDSVVLPDIVNKD